MRVLGISGSPRKGGNTSLLLEEALRAVGGRCETRSIAVPDLVSSLAFPAPEAFAPVHREIEAADALLLASPSHFGMPPAALKAVLDDTWEAARGRRFAGKAGAALVVENATGGEMTAMGLANWFVEHRMAYLGHVVGRGLKEREILYDIKAIREARDLANRVVDFLEGRRDGGS